MVFGIFVAMEFDTLILHVGVASDSCARLVDGQRMHDVHLTALIASTHHYLNDDGGNDSGDISGDAGGDDDNSSDD